MYFLMTNDVECFSIPLNKLDTATVKEVYGVGLPRLLDLYARHDIKCTFYFTGMFAEQSPESVELRSKRKYMQQNQSRKYIQDAT